MSINATYTGNIESPVHVALTNTSATTIGSVAGDRSITVAGWSIVNPTAGAVVCSIYWNDGAADRLVWRKSVPAVDTVTENNLPIRLGVGHSIKAIGANTVTVTLIYATQYQTRGSQA